MRCEELLRRINEYVDGSLEPELCTELEGHLVHCDPCTIVVDNIRRTITLYRGDEVVELPPRFRERLRSSLRERWSQLHGGSAPASGASV